MDPKPVRDDAGAQETIREAAVRRVPEELRRRFHEANGKADALRRRLEAALGDAGYEHGERAESVGQELRDAERELEEVSRQIREATPAQAQGGD